MSEFQYSQSELAEILGKSRSHLANTLRLLQLSPSIQDRVVAGEITAGHARALLAVRDAEAVARRIVEEGLSVREVEALASAEVPEGDAPRPGRPRRAAEKDAGIRSLEQAIARALGMNVALKSKVAGAARFASATRVRPNSTPCASASISHARTDESAPPRGFRGDAQECARGMRMRKIRIGTAAGQHGILEQLDRAAQGRGGPAGELRLHEGLTPEM